MRTLFFVYVAGAVLALWRTDGRLPTRLALALCWPVGPLAFAVTMTLLGVLALVVFPFLGLLAGVVAVAAWWAMR